MALSAALDRFGLAHGPVRQIGVAGMLLAFGLLVFPGLLYFVGLWLLGRYEGASLARTYSAVFSGLPHGSPASWIVVLGPYGLWLILGGLRAWWRLGARLS
jgi:hypothetical protein